MREVTIHLENLVVATLQRPLKACDIGATKAELTATLQKQKLVTTDNVAIIDAWIPAGREAAVSAALDKFECAYETSEPGEEDVPPVLLKNNGFATNFEWVLGMYSYPLYGKFDPTLIMSIFYFLIFGIMFADVGYGLVMVLACFLAPKIVKLSKGLADFAAPIMEVYYKVTDTTPLFTRYSIRKLVSNCNFSNEKARKELGYNPMTVAQSIKDMADWIKDFEANKKK